MTRYTIEEFNQIVDALVAWASTIRRNYRREDCECCGIMYHPRDGKPPSERKCTKKRDDCWCGHAGFREMWAYWDESNNDWVEEVDNW